MGNICAKYIKSAISITLLSIDFVYPIKCFLDFVVKYILSISLHDM